VRLEGNGQYVLIAMVLAAIIAGSGALPYLGLGISLDYGRNEVLAIFSMPGRFLSGIVTNMRGPNVGLAIGLNFFLYGLFFYFVIRPKKVKRGR
jgi:hypothetical protein